MNVKFHDWDCIVVRGQYSNGRTALKLVDSTTNQPIAVATVNVPDVPLEDNQVIIKNYAENAGIYNCLKDAGAISSWIDQVQVGFNQCPICEIIEE